VPALLAAMNRNTMSMHALGAENAEPIVGNHDGGGSGKNHATPGSSPRSPEAIISALASVPVELGRLVNGKSWDELARAAQDGGWGLIEILPHLRDWDVIFTERVNRVLDEDEPALEDYDDSLWAIEHEYSEQDPFATIKEFTALREGIVERLRAIDADGWNRTAILPKQGRVTLQWLFNKLCDHDAKHVVQARDVLA
jgi:hypothetical protein